MRIAARIRWPATALAAAAFAAASAQAYDYHQPFGPSGQGVIQFQGAGDPIHLEIAARAGASDERTGVWVPGTSPQAEVENLARIPSTIPVEPPRPGGFDWADAGIGAGIGIAVMLMLLSGIRALRGSGRLVHQ